MFVSLSAEAAISAVGRIHVESNKQLASIRSCTLSSFHRVHPGIDTLELMLVVEEAQNE